MRPSLAQKKGFVTTEVCYAHPWQDTDCLCHFAWGFCVTDARRSLCLRLEPWAQRSRRLLPPPSRLSGQRLRVQGSGRGLGHQACGT
jgi:hypothetical protein